MAKNRTYQHTDQWLPAQKAPPPPFAFHQSGMDGVWAGRAPLTAEDVDRLVQDAGIRCVIDLREPKEWSPPNQGMAALARIDAAGIERRVVSMRDAAPPTPQQLLSAVEWVIESVMNGPLYIHCRAGKQRTACVLFAALIRWQEGLDVTDFEAARHAWTTLKETYPLFSPMMQQVRIVYEALELKGVVPCYQCDFPLEVGEGVGHATCTTCATRRVTVSSPSMAPWLPPVSAVGPADKMLPGFDDGTFYEDAPLMCAACGMDEADPGSVYCSECGPIVRNLKRRR